MQASHICALQTSQKGRPMCERIKIFRNNGSTTPRFFWLRDGKRLQRLLVKVTTVRQLDDHCLTFRVRRF
jgi:hypothetical protein